MYLMLDVVLNHVAATNVPPTLTYNQYTPFNESADYHNFCWVTDYNNQTNVEQCWLGDTNVALADLNTEDPDVVSSHQSFIKNLVTTYKADGLRLDTAKHIRQDFYPDFLKAAGVYAVGEVLDVRANYTGAYTSTLQPSLRQTVVTHTLSPRRNGCRPELPTILHPPAGFVSLVHRRISSRLC